jgi:two-component response regulator ARR-A family
MASCKGLALGRDGGAAAPHVLAVDDSSVDRAVIASILRSSKFRGE